MDDHAPALAKSRGEEGEGREGRAEEGGGGRIGEEPRGAAEPARCDRQKEQEPGRGEVTWNGRDEAGRALPSGIYFARLLLDGKTVDSRRLALVK